MSAANTDKRRKPPGLMLYLSSRSLFEALEPAHVKHLLLSMMDYLAEGELPEMENAEERIAWAAMQDHINWDRQRYEKKCLQNQYNRFLREAEKYMERQDCPDYEDWLELSGQGTRKSAETLALAYDRYAFLRSIPKAEAKKEKTPT